MPLGSFFGGDVTCLAERRGEVKIEGGALSATVENVSVLTSGLVIKGESQFVDAKGVKMYWSCRPEQEE